MMRLNMNQYICMYTYICVTINVEIVYNNNTHVRVYVLFSEQKANKK